MKGGRRKEQKNSDPIVMALITVKKNKEKQMKNLSIKREKLLSQISDLNQEIQKRVNKNG